MEGWPVARVANDLRLCMHRRKRGSQQRGTARLRLGKCTQLFRPLSIPQFQNWEQFPSPLTLFVNAALPFMSFPINHKSFPIHNYTYGLYDTTSI